jgi:hypothetical protein
MEFDNIWQEIHKGLDQTVESYLNISKPFAQILKGKGIFGDFVETAGTKPVHAFLGQKPAKFMIDLENAVKTQRTRSASNLERIASQKKLGPERMGQPSESLAQ